MAVGVSSCSNDEVFEPANNKTEGTVKAVATVTIGDVESRTNKTPDAAGGFKFTWADGDQLAVIDSYGFNVGVLKLSKGAGTSNGTFIGELAIDGGEENLSVYYLGANISEPAKVSRKLNIDIANQSGKTDDITGNDVMYGKAEVTYDENGVANLNMSLKSILGFAHFYAHMNGAQPTNESMVISGANIYNGVTINLADGTLTDLNEGEITVAMNWNTGASDEGDTYVIMIPADDVTTEFSLNIAEKTYKAALPTRKYNAARVFNGGTAHGKDIYFTENGEWTLNYSAEGATNVPAPQTASGEFGLSYTFTVSTQVPVKEGYKFLGWSETANGAVNVGETITLTQPGVSKTIYAVWKDELEGKVYTLYYGENGKLGQQSHPYSLMNKTPWIFDSSEIENPVKEGSEFIGWADVEGATEVKYAPGSTIDITKEVTHKTVYPVFKQNSTEAGVTAPGSTGTDY